MIQQSIFNKNSLIFTHRHRQIFLYMMVSSILLYFVFSPAINVIYYGGDDYRYAFGGLNKACQADDSFSFMWTLGRPLQAYIDCLTFKFAYTIERMSVVRLLAVVCMGCAMGLLVDWLCVLGFSVGVAFFSAGSLFLVQQIYLDTLMMGSISLPVPLLLVLLGYRCLQGLPRYSQQSSLDRRWYFFSAIFIFLAMLAYPSMAFLFPALILTKLLFSNLSNWLETRCEAIQETMVFCTVGLAYFIWGYYNMRYHGRAPVTEAYQLDHPNLSILELLRRLLFLTNVFNDWWAVSPMSSQRVQGWITIVAIVGGAFWGTISFLKSNFYLQHGKQAVSWLVQVIVGVVVLLILSSGFFLLMPSLSLVQTRVLFGILSSGWVLMFWGVCRWAWIFPNTVREYMIGSVFCLFFLVQGTQANKVTMVNAISHAEYLNLDITAISNYLAKGNELRRIHFIIPKSNYPYDRFFMAHAALVKILGRGNVEVKWCSLPRGYQGEEINHQADMLACISNLSNSEIAVTYSYESDSFKATKAMLVIKNHYQEHNL